MSNKTFLEHSIGDYKASKLSFQNKLYEQAINLLQQSAEKFHKHILNEGGILPENNYSHNTLKPVTDFTISEIDLGNKSIEKLKNSYKIQQDEVLNESFQEQLNSTQNAAKDLKNKRYDLFENLNESDLNDLLNDIGELLNSETVFFDFKTSDLKAHFNTIDLVSMLPILSKFPEMEKITKNVFLELEDDNLLFQNLLNSQIKFTNLNLVIINLNQILLQHFAETRYPSKVQKELFSYDENNLIVKNYYKIYNFLTYSIDSYSKAQEDLKIAFESFIIFLEKNTHKI